MAHGDIPAEGVMSRRFVLGTVGEPINPDMEWYHRVIGMSRCPIIDTWWQTETGGHMILPLPGATELKPAQRLVHSSAFSLRYLMLTVMSLKGQQKVILLLKTAGLAKLERFMAIISALLTPL